MECGDNNNHSDNDNDNDDGCDDGNDITTARQRLKTGPAAGAGKAIWLYGYMAHLHQEFASIVVSSSGISLSLTPHSESLSQEPSLCIPLPW